MARNGRAVIPGLAIVFSLSVLKSLFLFVFLMMSMRFPLLCVLASDVISAIERVAFLLIASIYFYTD